MRSNKKAIIVWITRLVCSVYYPIMSIFNRLRKDNKIRILVYHSVHSGDDNDDEWSIPNSLFAQQMDYLAKNGFTISSLDEIITCLKNDLPIKDRTIALTFDDGYKNNFLYAYPELVRHNFTATFYLVTSFIDKDEPFPWIFTSYKRNTLAYDINRNMPLSWDEIYEMTDKGMTCGSHTHTHVNIMVVDSDTMQRELDEATYILKENLHKVSNTFVLPFGLIDKSQKNLKKYLSKRGYSAAFLGRFGAINKQCDLLDLPRIAIYGDDSMFFFKQKIMGAYDWIGPIRDFGRSILQICIRR